jgi:magnesium-transporting ATPase (P-type)
MTAGFAMLEFFKGQARNELTPPNWDPRKLPKADPVADRNGPRHPYADVIAGAVFLAWLLAFPHFPILIFGPYLAMHLLHLNIDLPAIWHTFYWIIVGFNCIQLATRIALLFRPVRRYYHFIEGVIHLLGIGVIAFLLRAHDYVGQATFGGSPMSPQTVATINVSIHRGLLLVLIIAIAQFLWDTVQWLRPGQANRLATKIGASS